MKKKIIVTGANGFIGSNLCNALTSKGYAVSALVRDRADVSLLDKTCLLIYCDYNNNNELKRTLSQYEIVIHLAAMTRASDFRQLYEANILLTRDVVQIVNNSQKCQQLIFLSSQAAVGPSKGTEKLDERTTEHPISWYGISKFYAERAVKRSEKSWTIIRPASVYGPGDKDFLVYFQLINRHLSPIPGTQTKYISLIYIDELIEIIEKCLDNSTVQSKIIHASDNQIYTMEQFVTTLSKIMNKKCLKVKIPNKLILSVGNLIDFFTPNYKIPPVFNKQKALEISQESWLIDSTESLRLLGLQGQERLVDNLYKTFLWYQQKNLL